MLKVFYGTDTVVVRREAMMAIDAYITDGYAVVRYTAEDYTPGLLLNLLQVDSLFGTKEVVVFDTPSEEGEFYEAIITVVAELQASVIPFVIIEQALLASQLRVFTKVGVEMYETKKTPAEKFNTFSLADALVARDKKTLWILLQEARRAAINDESIIGILWWQLKTLRLTYLTKNATEAGVKDFPYNKAKRAQKKFSKDEVEQLSRSLLAVYHDGHGGRRDMMTALEEWVLQI